MKLKRRFLLLAVSLLLMGLLQGTAAAVHPAQAIMQLYSKELTNQKTIEPYIVSILALNEVEHDRNLPQVKLFLQWYFSKLNYPDKQGLSGTIYVYTVEENGEQSTDKYDSVDGYAGMFLHLLRQYTLKTGDVQFLRDHWARIEDIAALIPLLQEKDGLTWAMPQYKIKYLMDNCEAYAGMDAYMELRSLIGMVGSLQHHATLIRVRSGILDELYDARSNSFYWAKSEDGSKSASSLNNFYPDALAQLFPIYFGLLTDKSTIRDNLWQELNRLHGPTISGVPLEQRILYELTKKKLESAGRKPK